ncbi:hypothetical protein 278BB001_269 [Bacillus phage 278BB001]|nr:hypothetical protein 278BB001_7 [Bacillus phage 278BB001]QZA70413.1 hypothetical protein 278BB001_269 [Bacillus phage 278BB001]
MEMSKEEVREWIVKGLSEFAEWELLASSDKLVDMEQVCTTELSSTENLGMCFQNISKPLHLDEDDTPTIHYELLFPEIRLYLEIRALHLMSSWCYYPKVVHEEEWTAERKAWFDMWDSFSNYK